MAKSDEYPTVDLREVVYTGFTHADRKLLIELHATVMELKALVAQAEPFLDSFLGGGGASKNPMNAIFGALMGGK
jgi:hypothetical protein